MSYYLKQPAIHACQNFIVFARKLWHYYIQGLLRLKKTETVCMMKGW